MQAFLDRKMIIINAVTYITRIPHAPEFWKAFVSVFQCWIPVTYVGLIYFWWGYADQIKYQQNVNHTTPNKGTAPCCKILQKHIIVRRTLGFGFA